MENRLEAAFKSVWLAWSTVYQTMGSDALKVAWLTWTLYKLKWLYHTGGKDQSSLVNTTAQ